MGKTYKINTEDSTVTYLRYLGRVSTAKGKIYKILTSTWIWGLSHRATDRILVYTNNNRYVGNYYLTTADDVLNDIKNNKLVFTNKAPDCDTHLITYLDFIHGIPKQFFANAKVIVEIAIVFLQINLLYNKKNRKPNIRSTYGK